MRKPIRFLQTLVVLAGSAVCHAQEARPVQCRFLSFGSGGDLKSALAINGDDESVECPLPTTQFSKAVMCMAKAGKISFFSVADRKPLTTATIPAGVGSAVVVFVRFPSNAGAPPEASTLRTYVIDDSPKNFPNGGAFVANFAAGEIRFVIGEHKGMLKSGGSHGYPMPEERDAFNMAPVVFEIRKDDKWRMANESSLRFLPQTRYLMFAYMDPISGRPKISTYQDMVPSKAPVTP